MRAIGIRKWMLMGMGMFLFFPALAYGITTVLDQHVFGRSQTAQQHAVADAIMIDAATGASNWRDPAWQRALQDRLTAVDNGILIQDPTGTEILREGHISNGARGGWGQTASQRVVVVDGGRQVGTITLFAPVYTGGPGRTAVMIAIAFAFLFFFWQLRRYVVWPLEAMGRAARQIARGNLVV